MSRKRFLKVLSIPGLLFVMVLFFTSIVGAAPKGTELAAIYINDGTNTYALPAACVRGEDVGVDDYDYLAVTCPLEDASELGSDGRGYAALITTDTANDDDAYYSLSLYGNSSYCGVFSIDDAASFKSDSALLDVGKVEANQSVCLEYIDSDGNTKYVSNTIVSSDDSVLTFSKDITNLNVGYYPVLILDAETNDFVGWILEDGTAISLFDSDFEASGGKQASNNETTGEPASEDETEEIKSIDQADNLSNLTTDKSEKKMINILLALVIGFVALIIIAGLVVLIVVLVKKSNKKQPQQMNIPQTPVNTENMIGDDTISNTVLDEGNLPPGYSNVGGAQQMLVAKGGYMDGRLYPIEMNQEILIGRMANCTIRYPADTKGVSRIHCKLYWMNGQLTIEDQNSSNGTYLQRIGKLSPMVPVTLMPGDVFYIGEKNNAFLYQAQK